MQTRGDGLLMAALVALLPAVTYAAVHWVVLSLHVHVYSMLLLSGGMPLLLTLLPGGMWWLEPAPASPVNAGSGAFGAPTSISCLPYISITPSSSLAGFLRKTLLAVALLVALVGFEGRVVFHGFGQYIQLPPPWNWVAVTFALFGCAVVGLMHVTGALGGSVDVTVAGSFLLLCTTAGEGRVFWRGSDYGAASGRLDGVHSDGVRWYGVHAYGACGRTGDARWPGWHPASSGEVSNASWCLPMCMQAPWPPASPSTGCRRRCWRRAGCRCSMRAAACESTWCSWLAPSLPVSAVRIPCN